MELETRRFYEAAARRTDVAGIRQLLGDLAEWETFQVGLAAGIGAGIGMGCAEALSDDGSFTGRGRPWVRGVICGLMTTVGAFGHTFPYFIPHVQTATAVAVGVVLLELGVNAWVRHGFMDTSLRAAIIQVVVGGLLVFLTGILISSS